MANLEENLGFDESRACESGTAAIKDGQKSDKAGLEERDLGAKAEIAAIEGVRNGFKDFVKDNPELVKAPAASMHTPYIRDP